MLNITEVRVKLMEGRSDRLRAFCSITIDDDFVVHDLRVIAGKKGRFVAMPSRKLTDNCPRCGGKNHLRAKYCNDCGHELDENRAGSGKLHVDVAHPINTPCRKHIQSAVLEAYDEEIERKEQGLEPEHIYLEDDLDSLTEEESEDYEAPEWDDEEYEGGDYEEEDESDVDEEEDEFGVDEESDSGPQEEIPAEDQITPYGEKGTEPAGETAPQFGEDVDWQRHTGEEEEEDEEEELDELPPFDGFLDDEDLEAEESAEEEKPAQEEVEEEPEEEEEDEEDEDEEEGSKGFSEGIF